MARYKVTKTETVQVTKVWYVDAENHDEAEDQIRTAIPEPKPTYNTDDGLFDDEKWECEQLCDKCDCEITVVPDVEWWECKACGQTGEFED